MNATLVEIDKRTAAAVDIVGGLFIAGFDQIVICSCVQTVNSQFFAESSGFYNGYLSKAR